MLYGFYSKNVLHVHTLILGPQQLNEGSS